MAVRVPSRPRLMQRLRRRRGRNEGSAAIEFAMVALPFFFKLFAILEIGLVFITDALLENSVMETSRLIRTGEAAQASMTPAQFKTSLCSRMNVFSSGCEGRTTVDVRVVPQYRNPTPKPPDPMSGKTFDTRDLDYTNGQPGNLVLVRIWYKQPMLTPFLSQALSKLGDGDSVLTATMTFRNEPWDQ